MRTICLGLAILLSFVSIAYAQDQNTQLVGSQGGAPFDDSCHPGDVVIGFNWNAGKSLETIAAVCQPQSNGVLTGQPYGLRTWGKNTASGGSYFGVGPGVDRCPAGAAVSGLDIWVNKFQDVDSEETQCSTLNSLEGRFLLSRTLTGGGQSVGLAQPSQCPANMRAVGIIGRSGDVVNSLGLKCSSFPWLVAAQPPPTNIVKVIGAADVYDRPNPGNVPPKYPDGLDPAAPQNIVLVYLLEVGKDENVNWYRVNWNGSPPQPLWVYNGQGNFPFDAGSLATATVTVNGGH
jgi:hypothetical protein